MTHAVGSPSQARPSAVHSQTLHRCLPVSPREMWDVCLCLSVYLRVCVCVGVCVSGFPLAGNLCKM